MRIFPTVPRAGAFAHTDARAEQSSQVLARILQGVAPRAHFALLRQAEALVRARSRHADNELL